MTATVCILAMLRWRNIASFDPEAPLVCGTRQRVGDRPDVAGLSLRTLVANSELAVCSRASEAGGLAFATVLGPLVATWMTGDGGAAEFATSVSGFRFHAPATGRTVPCSCAVGVCTIGQ